MNMKKGILLLACLIGMISCSDHKDVFNPNAEAEKKKEEFDKNFPVTDIDPSQNWNAFTIAKVNVTVNEDWGETYVVKVYTDNPLSQDSNAMLLAKGEIKSGETFSADIEIPKGLTLVWVARVDSHKRRLVKPVGVVDGKIESVFGATIERAVAESRSTVDVEPLPYSEIQLQKFMNEGTDLSVTPVANIAAAKGTYFVPAGKTISWTWNADGDSGSSGFNTGDVKLIIAGNVTYTSQKSIGNGVQVIVARGGTLNLSADMVFNTNAGMVVMPEASVNGQGHSITFANGTDGKTNYVAGTVNLGTWNNNGGITYNCGTVNLTNLQGSSTGSTFINSGHVRVTTVGAGNASVQNIINNCLFEISGNCVVTNLTTGPSSDFRCGASLDTNSGTWNLGEYSIVAVSGKANFTNTDVIGPTTYYSLLRFSAGGKVEWTGSWQSNITKGYMINNIYIESGSWFDFYNVINGNAGSGINKLGNGGTVIAPPGNANLWVPSDGYCTKGNTPVDKGDDDDEKDEINAAIYAFEDLGSIGDYDFNDVVFKISHLKGSTEATAELLAAGGTMKVAVKYGNQVLWNEVHEAFGATTTTMVNTGRGSGTKKPEIKTITVPANVSFNELIFSIVVTSSTDETKTGTLVSEPTTGKAPQCLCIPATWKWPKENVSIVNAYNTEGHSFGDWAGNATQANDWYNYPVSDKVYQ